MKIRTKLVSNSSSSSFIIYNKTNDTKKLADFMWENPEVLGNLCYESKKSIAEVIQLCREEDLYPGENYIDSSNENYNGTIITRDLRAAFHRSLGTRSQSFEWKEAYNEQWY